MKTAAPHFLAGCTALGLQSWEEEEEELEEDP